MPGPFGDPGLSHPPSRAALGSHRPRRGLLPVRTVLVWQGLGWWVSLCASGRSTDGSAKK